MILPQKVVYNEKSNIFGTRSLSSPLSKNLQSLLRTYLHGKEEVPCDANACFVVEKHKATYPKRISTRFKLLHQFEFNSKLWQVYMDEAMPHVLNKLVVMMN